MHNIILPAVLGIVGIFLSCLLKRFMYEADVGRDAVVGWMELPVDITIAGLVIATLTPVTAPSIFAPYLITGSMLAAVFSVLIWKYSSKNITNVGNNIIFRKATKIKAFTILNSLIALLTFAVPLWATGVANNGN